METIEGISSYPVTALIIFFAFFVGLAFWVLSYKKEKIDELSQIPLNDNQTL
ncbi:CcoQ/FixQ family Cbb3-type cytochrome c oxidase assembly chaperone [Flavobacterium sp.]|uniref:CcoQ/FixQ family Cbb3-type cytochrome c oxidase assembly chaperone n=1 Tax=Flavobacterium sp. TaxID=239 RepID=UPI00345C9383